MIKATRKYVLDTQLFINAFRHPTANNALQRFHRAFAPFEHLSLVVAQELRAGVKRPRDQKLLERHVLNVFDRAGRAATPSANVVASFRRRAVRDDMSRTPQDRQTLRVRGSLSFIVVLTVWALYALDGDLFPPHGNSLVYAIALTWLVTIAVGLGTGFIFAAADPALFSLAPWERGGEIYDRVGIRAFRWVLLRSGLGWINPNFHVRHSRQVDETRISRIARRGS